MDYFETAKRANRNGFAKKRVMGEEAVSDHPVMRRLLPEVAEIRAPTIIGDTIVLTPACKPARTSHLSVPSTDQDNTPHRLLGEPC
jgi:hypothetical protein